MAITYVFLTTPLATAMATSGKIYTAGATGIITGVLPNDALSLATTSAAPLQLLMATGATADRPGTVPATAVAGALNGVNPQPPLGFVFHDSTLTTECYFVGTQRASTGWVDRSGSAV